MKSRTPLKANISKKSNLNSISTLKQASLRQLSKQRSSKGLNSTSKNEEGYLNVQTQQKRMQRTKNVNIIKYLDQRDRSHVHKYKDFRSHSKKSNFEEIKMIIEQLLDKHATERSISLSQQYILTGYLVMYLQNTRNFNKTPKNPFSLKQRIETKNSIVNSHFLDPLNLTLSPRRLNSSLSSRKLVHKNSNMNDKKLTMGKQFERLKLLWQLFQLKEIVCPDISKISGFNQTDAHKEMAQLMGKLKNIEKNRAKIGEEKSLSQVQKIMINFEENIKKSFC